MFFQNSEKIKVSYDFLILVKDSYSLTKFEWEICPKSPFLMQKMKLFQIKDFLRKISITNHDSIWCQKLLNIIFMSNINFNSFWESNNMPILGKMFVPYCKTKSQQIQHFNMVHRRDISLAESRSTSRFLST